MVLGQEHSEANAQGKCDEELVSRAKVLAREWGDEIGDSCRVHVARAGVTG